MHKTTRDALAFVREFEPLVRDVRSAEIVLAPPFTSLAAVADLAGPTTIGVAAQNLWYEREGAFTGEVSAAMIKDVGAGWVIVGHSERRQLFGETDVWVNHKVRAALGAALVPILCIGETLEERERSADARGAGPPAAPGLDGLTGDQTAGLVLAYEPVWAIGTGKNATPAEADDAHRHIRGRLRQWMGATAADRCRILYGGSVKPANARVFAGVTRRRRRPGRRRQPGSPEFCRHRPGRPTDRPVFR